MIHITVDGECGTCGGGAMESAAEEIERLTTWQENALTAIGQLEAEKANLEEALGEVSFALRRGRGR